MIVALAQVAMTAVLPALCSAYNAARDAIALMESGSPDAVRADKHLRALMHRGAVLAEAALEHSRSAVAQQMRCGTAATPKLVECACAAAECLLPSVDTSEIVQLRCAAVCHFAASVDDASSVDTLFEAHRRLGQLSDDSVRAAMARLRTLAELRVTSMVDTHAGVDATSDITALEAAASATELASALATTFHLDDAPRIAARRDECLRIAESKTSLESARRGA